MVQLYFHDLKVRCNEYSKKKIVC